MKQDDHVVECPCYQICKQVGIEPNRWCRYRESELPPPGTWRFNPKEHWCPPGVQATVTMLAHMASAGGDPDVVAALLDQVQVWARETRKQAENPYKPTRHPE